MSDTLLHSGEAEVFKLSVHLCLFGLSAMAAGYNAMAFSERRESHLGVNALVYGSLAGWEWYQMRRHLDHLRQNS